MSLLSMTLILPAQYRDDGNAISITLGHDVEPGHTYSVPLSATGDEPATHYGCRPWCTPGFALLVQMAQGMPPPEGTSPELVAMAQSVAAQWPDTIAALIADVRETDQPYQHWTDVLGAHGLAVVETGGI
jgi:hypothetical protein